MSVAAFLRAAGMGDAARRPIAGDASARRYERVGSRVLMIDAPGPDTERWLDVRDRLEAVGLSVPTVVAADAAAGLVLMEDLGERVLAPTPPLYADAARAAAALSTARTDGLPDHAAGFAEQARIVSAWYAPVDADAVADAVTRAVAALPAGRGMIHRDFHAENLFHLPGRAGARAVGIIDHQDAGSGPFDYDLASLLRDVRRDVPGEVSAAATDAFVAETGRRPADVARGVAICAAVRNLRILGVFARLCLRDGKPGYLRWMPRTWALLRADATESGLEDLLAALPEPTPHRLEAMAAAAGLGAPLHRVAA